LKQRAAIAADLANLVMGDNPGKGHVQGPPNGVPSISTKEAADSMDVKQITQAEYHKLAATPFGLWCHEVRHQQDCTIFSIETQLTWGFPKTESG